MALVRELLQKGNSLLWAQVAVVNLAAIVGYIVTRLFSTPFDNRDVGNWSEMLGLSALFIEGALVLLSAQVVAGTLTAPRRNPSPQSSRSFSHGGASKEGRPDTAASYQPSV